jgi:hypothetical protein
MSKYTIPEVIPLFKEYLSKPGNEVGGCLHIITDDFNIEDCHIEFCIDYARKRNDVDAIRLGDILLQMSKTQRKKLVHLI